ncbi:MAG: hypothetical protein ACTTH3_04515 [Schwartzia sp. (in: firmicutes)]
MRRLFSFREMEKSAQLRARKQLLRDMESIFCHWKNVKSFVFDTFHAGVVIRPQDVYVTEDDTVIFLPHEIDMEVALQQSGIGRQYLMMPENRELFLANAKVSIRQVCPLPFDVRFVLISVAVPSFENNDNGKAFFACKIAASLLEVYLNDLVVTISNSFRAMIIQEHARISSPAFLDGYLENQGEVFLQDGRLSPLFEEEEAASW